MFKWLSERLDKRFDQIDKRFDKIDQRFDEIDKDLDAIRMDTRMIDARLSRIEGQDEERFRNEVKMIAGKH